MTDSHGQPEMQDNEMVDNRERQDNEILALEAIYEIDFISEKSPTNEIYGTLSVRLDMGDQITLVLDTLPSESCTQLPPDTETKLPLTITIRFLPPIIIRFHIPPTYPSRSPPAFTLESRWLTSHQRSLLKRRLLSIWDEEKDVCLYNFAEFLGRKGLEEIGIIDTEACHNGKTLLNIKLDKDILEIADWIMDYDRQMVREEFEQSSFDCGICFETKSGKNCFRFGGCRHVFCKSCIVDYFTVLINDGSVLLVGCPDSGCKKQQQEQQKEAEPTEISTPQSYQQIPTTDLQTLLPQNLLSRYLHLLETHILSLNPNTTHCPRPACQSPVARDPKQEKLCICPICKFAFCFYCMKCWHGSAQFCRVNNMEKVVEEFIKAKEEGDSQKVKGLEVRYGKKTLERMSREWVVERESRRWLEENSTKCPTCSASVQKSTGCNHMTCQICQSHFCYLCGQSLNARQPYAHFNDVKSRCFGALFDGLNGGRRRWDDEEEERWGGGEEDVGDFFPDEALLRLVGLVFDEEEQGQASS